MKIAIIGLGLIGSSIAKTLKQKNVLIEIMAYDNNRNSLIVAKQQNVIAHIADSFVEMAHFAEIILIATPLNTFTTILTGLAPYLSNYHIVTDVGSTKVTVLNQAKDILKENFKYFVPAHPIAGSEQSGFIAGRVNLFDSRRVIITPDEQTDLSALDKVRSLWQLLGASIVEMTATAHDELLAATSHVPHILAYAFMNSLEEQINNPNFTAGIGGGFKDFTRIAASNPLIWRDICLHNREAILQQLNRFTKNFAKICDALENSKADELETLFEKSRYLKITANS